MQEVVKNHLAQLDHTRHLLMCAEFYENDYNRISEAMKMTDEALWPDVYQDYCRKLEAANDGVQFFFKAYREALLKLYNS